MFRRLFGYKDFLSKQGNSNPSRANKAVSIGRTGGAYTVSENDRVHPLPDLPQSSVGAPLPCVLASEKFLAVAYLCEQHDPNWDGTYARMVSTASAGETVCVVQFQIARAHFFGPPNDEAFSGHPLADRGLTPYGSFEVKRSSWINALERMNRVHDQHKPEHFSSFRHIVLAFHDRTFECVAKGYTFQIQQGNLQEVVGGLCALL
jgi:hypothetical protein